MLLNYLNNLNIRNKLIIFLIVPVLTILYLSISGIHLKIQEHQNAKSSQEFISVFLRLENLVYELQNERGLSAGFVASAGKLHRHKLHQQRQVTDEKINLFLLELSIKDPDKIYWGLPDVFNKVQLKLQKLPITRNNIDNLTTDRFFDSFSEIISLGLSIAQRLQLISNNVALGRKSDAYTTLLLLEELSAKERGLINAVFTSSSLSAEHIKNISSVISGQDDRIKHFNSIAITRHSSLLFEKMKHQSVSDVGELRTAVLHKASRNDRLNSLLNLIGYGGLIHDFKNYVFRGQQGYIDGFNRKYVVVSKIIEEYQALPGMSDKEIAALNTIKLTFHKYKSMLKVAGSLRKKGKTFTEIDSVVKVNDKPARDAIQYLHKSVTGLDTSQWWDKATTRINLIIEVSNVVRNDMIEQINQYSETTVRTLYIYVILTLVSLIISFFIGYRLIHRIVGGIMNIESHMSKMSTQQKFDSLLVVKGNDEISKVAESFNNLISERTKYEVQLRLAAMVFDKTSEAMVVTDTNNQFIAINPSFTKITGYSIEDVKGATPALLQSGIQGKEFYKNLWNSLQQKGYWSGEIYNRRKNGEIYPEWLNINVIKNSDGKITRHIAMFTDISERKKMEDEIHSSEQHLKLYREQAPMATIEWNPDFQVINWNKAAETMFGYTIEEVKGRNFVEIMLPDSAIVDIKQLWKDLMAQTGGNSSINENLTKDGRIILCEWHNTPLKDESGNVIGAASIVQDITHRTELEKQLNRSQKMDAIGKLTGGIAHDYNNMLGVILGYSELLEENLQDNPKLNKYLQEIYHAADRGAKLTSKLLSFTRNKSSNEESLIINTLLEYQKDMLEKLITARIKLHYELGDELWPILLDSSELEDVIINLSINAMHAIDGNGDLTIKTNNVALKDIEAQSLGLVAGDYVEISFTDTGCGMNETTKLKMFDPFYSTKGDKGTGLGLSQVYGFVQRGKGSISVTSELGKGTELRLYFPRNNLSISSVQLEDKESSDNLSGTEVIMVVDDEEALRKLTSVVLTKHGYKVICANDGKQALEMLEKESVDLLLSDVIMPEMDGFQLAKIVHEKYPGINIQLASGYTDNREKEHKRELWYNEILYKPFDGNTLLLVIRKLLDRS